MKFQKIRFALAAFPFAVAGFGMTATAQTGDEAAISFNRGATAAETYASIEKSARDYCRGIYDDSSAIAGGRGGGRGDRHSGDALTDARVETLHTWDTHIIALQETKTSTTTAPGIAAAASNQSDGTVELYRRVRPLPVFE